LSFLPVIILFVSLMVILTILWMARNRAETGREIPRNGHSRAPTFRYRHALSIWKKEVAMSTILKILSIAGLAVIAASASAQAQPSHAWNHGAVNHGAVNHAAHFDHGWDHRGDHRWDHAHWNGGGYYGPRYYGAPPVVAYPPAYYGPPSLNFNIPLG